MIRQIENQILSAVPDESTQHNMIFFSGPADGNPYYDQQYNCCVIDRCIIDMRSIPMEQQNKAINGICGAHMIVMNTLIIGAKKAVLCGNGDWPAQDRENGTWIFNNCVWIDCGRRCPEAQDGTTVIMRDCWVHNWGTTFDVRAFGAWARTGAHIIAYNCLFTQSGFWRLSSWHMLQDLGDHFGQAWNDRGGIKLCDFVTPGLCRGLTATKAGYVIARQCYKNKWWIAMQNARDNMDCDAARKVVQTIQQNLHPEYERVLGRSLEDIFQEEV